ncbi:MAG: glycosyltransferase family 4 protein [Lachnospiraceae bacterium]|nr:glycosyltransferase family 4 protein [Lachnospiraceae bacterium]
MNKRHILIATDSYNGKLATANGICVQHIAEEFLKHDYNVDVLCYRHKNEKSYEETKKIRLYRIRVNLVHYFRFAYESGQNRLIREISKLLMVTLNRIQTLICIHWFPMRAPFFSRRYAREMKKLYKKNNYGMIISSYCPFEAAYAGWRTKKEFGATVCLYSLDSLSNFSGNKFFLTEESQKEKGRRWEKVFFDAYDCVLQMKCHQVYYEGDVYNKYKNKFKYVDFPHITDHQKENKHYNNYLLMYVGSIRTSYFTQVIDLLEPFISDKYLLEIYGGNTSADLGIERSKLMKINLSLKGRVDHDKLIQIEEEAGCFLSMGNYGSSSNFVPSKIFEYISTGKKMIHFYKNPNDSCLPYLKNYKACCLVNVDDNKDKSIKIIEDFLKSEVGIIPSEEIKKVYLVNTPEYTYSIINEYLNKTYDISMT